jgi:hypothetical protein
MLWIVMQGSKALLGLLLQSAWGTQGLTGT